jgi:catechol 2,3-dioxygenase-like lactoylglutathione lyase family enzyme
MSRFLKIAPRLPAADLAKSCDFYTRVLGFALGSTWPKERPWFALLVRDDVIVQLVATEAGQTESAGCATISIDVDRAQQLADELMQHVPIEWGPEVYWYGRREFAVKDPKGNLLIFSEETDDPPTCLDEG